MTSWKMHRLADVSRCSGAATSSAPPHPLRHALLVVAAADEDTPRTQDYVIGLIPSPFARLPNEKAAGQMGSVRVCCLASLTDERG